MNPMTNVKNVLKLSERELSGQSKTSWHDQYKNSAWIFIGGLPYDLTEGDVICVFSQYGEIADINLVRDKATGRPRGFAFICYEDQRSTILAVDNLNGIKVLYNNFEILGRTIRVDHCEQYKTPNVDKVDEGTAMLSVETHTHEPLPQKIESSIKKEPQNEKTVKKRKKEKKSKKSKKNKKEKRKRRCSSSSSRSD